MEWFNSILGLVYNFMDCFKIFFSNQRIKYDYRQFLGTVALHQGKRPIVLMSPTRKIIEPS